MLKISRYAAKLTMADKVELNSSQPDREINEELYQAICSALPKAPQEHLWLSSQTRSIESREVVAHYSRGRNITVSRAGSYTAWRTEQNDGTVNFTYKEIKGQ